MIIRKVLHPNFHAAEIAVRRESPPEMYTIYIDSFIIIIAHVEKTRLCDVPWPEWYDSMAAQWLILSMSSAIASMKKLGSWGLRIEEIWKVRTRFWDMIIDGTTKRLSTFLDTISTCGDCVTRYSRYLQSPVTHLTGVELEIKILLLHCCKTNSNVYPYRSLL